MNHTQFLAAVVRPAIEVEVRERVAKQIEAMAGELPPVVSAHWEGCHVVHPECMAARCAAIARGGAS